MSFWVGMVWYVYFWMTVSRERSAEWCNYRVSDVPSHSERAHIRTSKPEIVENREKMNQFLYITANSPQGLQQVAKAAVPCFVSVLSSFLFFSCFCFHLLVCRESQPLRGLKENTNRKFFSLCPLEGSRSSMRSQGWVGGVLESRGWVGGIVSCHYPWSFEASVWATNTNPQMPNLDSVCFIYKKGILCFSLLWRYVVANI